MIFFFKVCYFKIIPKYKKNLMLRIINVPFWDFNVLVLIRRKIELFF